MTPQSLKEIYLIADQEIRQTESILYDLKQQMKKLEIDLIKYRRWKIESEDAICKACNGKGALWHSYDQDDSKLEDCIKCNGTGLSR